MIKNNHTIAKDLTHKRNYIRERTNSPTFLTLLKYTVSAALLITANYVPWFPWLHFNNGFNYGTDCCTCMRSTVTLK